MDAIRKESEQADRVLAYELYHSVGGGTGSGLGSLILRKISEEYGESLSNTVSVFLSAKLSE